jgi:hypothetical protein
MGNVIAGSNLARSTEVCGEGIVLCTWRVRRRPTLPKESHQMSAGFILSESTANRTETQGGQILFVTI